MMDDCSLCQFPYDLTEKVPHILSRCGHTFCIKCLELLKNGSQEVLCPVCRKPHDLRDRKGKLTFPKNFALITVLEGQTQEAMQNAAIVKAKEIKNSAGDVLSMVTAVKTQNNIINESLTKLSETVAKKWLSNELPIQPKRVQEEHAALLDEIQKKLLGVGFASINTSNFLKNILEQLEKPDA